MEIDPNKQHFNGCIRQDDHEPFGECVYEDHPMMPLGTCRPGCTNPASHSKPLDCFVNGLDLGPTEPWRHELGERWKLVKPARDLEQLHHNLVTYKMTEELAEAGMNFFNEDPMTEPHIPYSGKRYVPDYYKPQRKNPRIDPSADASDVSHAFRVDDPRVANVVERLLRAGKKPGESYLKDLNKAAEDLHRAIEYAEMEGEG